MAGRSATTAATGSTKPTAPLREATRAAGGGRAARLRLPGDRWGVEISVYRRRGGRIRDRRRGSVEGTISAGSGAGALRVLGARPEQVAAPLAALGHVKRISILAAIQGGLAQCGPLRRAVRSKVGPLYFHLRHLERAGLIRIRPRLGYELTAPGRDWLAVACGAAARIGRTGLRGR